MNLTLQDLSAILVPMVSLLVGIPGFMWRHFDKRIDKLENKIDTVEGRLNTKIDTVDKKIDAVNKKIDTVEERLGKKMDNVRDRVSRVEGQLAPAKVVAFGGIWAGESAEQKSVRKQ